MKFAPHPSSPPPVRLVGRGPIRVMTCHGWIADHTLFAPFIACIDEHKFTYAFFDCRGYGDRRAEAGPRTISAVAADVWTLADALGWSRFNVLGHSMGGMVAQRLLVDAPQRLASAVLLAPIPAGGARLAADRRALLQRALLEPAARRELININSGGAQSAEWVERLLELSLRTTRPEALEAYLASWSDTDFSADVKDVPVPVHVILGDRDPGASHQRMQQTVLQWYSHATCRTMAGVGHYPMQERPGELYALASRQLLAAQQ